MEAPAHRDTDRRPDRIALRRLIASCIALGCSLSILADVRADIPWPEVVQRLAQENEKLARRPQGHSGEYFIVCTLYYTPVESGFTSESGLHRGVIIQTPDSTVRQVFGSTRWKIVDTGGGLRKWQVDLYYGEDEPLGPGRFMARPRGTTFEYAYSEARVSK